MEFSKSCSNCKHGAAYGNCCNAGKLIVCRYSVNFKKLGFVPNTLRSYWASQSRKAMERRPAHMPKPL
jgi:hypothetical protein